MFLPILECIVWHLVEILQIVCSLVEVVEESLQILCYIANILWIDCMFSCLSCRSLLGLCAITTTPSSTGSQQNPTKQDKTLHHSHSLSLSFSLLSRMSWSKLSGLLKTFTFLKISSPTSPQKSKKNKRRKRRKQNDDQLSARFCCFWIFHGMTWRGVCQIPFANGQEPTLTSVRGFWICCGVFAFPVDGNYLLDLLWRF